MSMGCSKYYTALYTLKDKRHTKPCVRNNTNTTCTPLLCSVIQRSVEW